MNTAVTDNAVSLSNDRFGFTLFVSICLHVVIILGVGFGLYDQLTPSSTLEITLATYKSSEAPDNPDFLAQENQQGSGSLDEAAAPGSPVQSRFSDDAIRDVAPFRESSETSEPVADEQLLATDTAAPDTVNQFAEDIAPPDPAEQPLENLTNKQLEDTLASLQAQLDIRRQAYAKRPRRYTISSASTQKSRDALYLDNWRKKVESVGNLNYPARASAEGIYGNLRLLVSLRSDGSVAEVRILSSSGHRILDESAIDIVHLAAPFDPFPDSLKQEADILDIIRTWQFHQNNSFRSF